jgi:RNA polymerase sigma-70 factor (ECF subfamily)
LNHNGKITNPDEHLLRRCSGGHAKSQESIYLGYYSYALSVALRLVPNREDAREVVNDSFVKIFLLLKEDIPLNFLGWLRTIVVRTAIDRYRSENPDRSPLHLSEEHISNEHSIEFPTNLEAEEIIESLNQLNPTERMVFILFEIEGYRHEEIAMMLGIEAGTSRSHLSRAKATLRIYLTKLCQYEKRYG